MSMVPVNTDNKVFWSIFNTQYTRPQQGKTGEIVLNTMRFLRFAEQILDYAPNYLRNWVWRLLSGTSTPAPQKRLITGDYFHLNEVGIFVFLIEKMAKAGFNDDLAPLRFRIGPIPMIMPRDWNFVYELFRSGNVKRKDSYKLLQKFFGQGIFTEADDKLWKEQRKIVLDLFLRGRLRGITEGMADSLIGEVRQAIERNPGQPIEFVGFLSRITLFAFCDTVLEVEVRDLADELAPAINKVLTYINGALEPITIPFGENYACFWENRNTVHRLLGIIVDRVREKHRRNETLPENPLVEKILKETDDSKRQILTELMISMVLGGHETTARLMLGGLYALMKHPHYIDKIREESKHFLEKWKGNLYAALKNKKDLPLLQAVLQETLRLFPPVWIAGRTAKCDFELQGQTIRKGTRFLINFLMLHRLKGNWGENAEVFYPERFIGKKISQKKFSPFAIPSAASCPGRNFAELEFLLALILLFQEFDLELADPNQEPRPESGGTLRLFDKVLVHIKPRKNEE